MRFMTGEGQRLRGRIGRQAVHDPLGIILGQQSRRFDQHGVEGKSAVDQHRCLTGPRERTVPDLGGPQQPVCSKERRDPIEVPAAAGTERALGVLFGGDGVGVSNEVELQ